MASDPFFEALGARRSIYAINDTSPIPDSRIVYIVNKTVLHSPSSFNVQSARVVVVLKDDHRKLWDLAKTAVETSLPEAVSQALLPRIAAFRAGYGSVLFFEDNADLTALSNQHSNLGNLVYEWSDHATGMHQLAVWTALSVEGFGASLQHYNFLPGFTEKICEEWKLPKDWTLKAQLVFGKRVGEPREKISKPVEDRVKVFGQ